jgi:aryl-alcohol dehydrogenase-like predicted oxidoreductase
MYGRQSYLSYLDKYAAFAEKSGSSRVGLAYRWVVWNSVLDAEKGDFVVLGASSGKQLEEVLEEIAKGPLDEEIVKGLSDMWKLVEEDAPADNFTTYVELLKAGAFKTT